MARPLTGSIRLLPSGRFQASVPEAPGSTRRMAETFDSRREADAWVAKRVADLKSGRGPERPEAQAFREVSSDHGADGRRGPDARPAGAADLVVLFQAWHQARYVLLGNGPATRGEAVRSDFELHVAPFFAACDVADVRDITRDHVVALSRWLAGFPVTVTPYQADGCGPTVDLDARASALEQSTASNVLSVLEQILDEALARGIVAVNVAKNVSARTPNPARQRQHRPRIEELPLELVRELATHLDVIAQTVLWLYRLLGCRASEAFGPRVRDFQDRGPGRHGWLTLSAQGGRSFVRYDDDGNVQVQPSSDRLKTTWSERTLPLPIALSDLLRVVVAAFHTDPVTGEIDLDARLIPGVRQADRGGQARFRTQLGFAVAQLAGDRVPADGGVELKAFRSQVASELYAAGFDQPVRHSYLGHELGRTVQERHYIVVSSERLVLVAQY